MKTVNNQTGYEVGTPEYNRFYNQRAYTKRRKVWFAWMKELKSAPCVDCGHTYHPAAMQFDHVGDDKTSDVTTMIGSRRELVEAELAKCELRCANCHYIRHHAHAYEDLT